LFQIFRELELPAEHQKTGDLRDQIRVQREKFVNSITNNTDVRNLERLVSVELAAYEQIVAEAAQGNLLIEPENDYPIASEKWSRIQAVFFASTVLTTIGDLEETMKSVLNDE
jgi:hypothetical protein